MRDDQISFSPTRRINGFSHPQIIQKNGLVGQFLSGIPHPGFVTIDFYKKFSADPLLKSSICEYTKCLVAKGNEEIYGEETCANDAFMNETMSTGKIPVSRSLLVGCIYEAVINDLDSHLCNFRALM